MGRGCQVETLDMAAGRQRRREKGRGVLLNSHLSENMLPSLCALKGQAGGGWPR